MTHELKVWPEFFAGIRSGRKPFEVRLDDRNFAVDDCLVLKEWDKVTGVYTGNISTRRVTSILRGEEWGIKRGYVVMGLMPGEETFS